MIATLSGKVQFIHPDRAVIDVGGVGYEVFLSADGISRLPERGGEAFLHIHTHVREDAFILFGFPEEDEKELFLILKTVSGIGPRLALAILSGMRVPDLCQAIGENDVKRLTTLQGVGKRTAERLCVELKDKVSHLGGAVVAKGAAPVSTVSGSTVMDAISALYNLGYADPVAREALTVVKRRLGDEAFAALSVSEMIREGLKALA
ncbi:Holliday junction branch migration protein RuvA [Desulfopila aestuarii]|uniref:Holliday junction branch migration complex subunit RuvA n=1 Tax=Desulfopila aestuarii DSM 18488 TaxID=1121416 RepID=A0A1M7XZB0_9BACT|nr:Holliday junction branch migration protein RuvA [Desulfopila aestuarii]SHO44456.1 Holliday junction DNA helicase subunit RuvA [Desulfopila aestuarii DSM 18488]